MLELSHGLNAYPNAWLWIVNAVHYNLVILLLVSNYLKGY